MQEIANEIKNSLQFEFNVIYDEKDAVGRRYRRQDAIGTPFCITVDHKTKEDQSVTMRYRDSMDQIRVPIDNLATIINKDTSMKFWLKKLY